MPEQAALKEPGVPEPGSSLWITLPSPRSFGQGPPEEEPDQAPQLRTPGQQPQIKL